MSAHALPRINAAPRSWLRRVLDIAADAAAAAARAWRDRRRLEREQRELAMLAELDPRMLRDIGAPPSMEGEANAWRDACRAEREHLRLGGGTIDTRFW